MKCIRFMSYYFYYFYFYNKVKVICDARDRMAA